MQQDPRRRSGDCHRRARHEVARRCAQHDLYLVVEVNVRQEARRFQPHGAGGGIVEKHAHPSVRIVAIYNAATGKADRVGIKTLRMASVRVLTTSGARNQGGMIHGAFGKQHYWGKVAPALIEKFGYNRRCRCCDSTKITLNMGGSRSRCR